MSAMQLVTMKSVKNTAKTMSMGRLRKGRLSGCTDARLAPQLRQHVPGDELDVLQVVDVEELEVDP